MRTLRLFLLVSLAVTVFGCGQKGPLVLPDAQRPHKQISISRPPPPKPQPAVPASTPAPSDTDGGEAKPDAAPQS